MPGCGHEVAHAEWVCLFVSVFSQISLLPVDISSDLKVVVSELLLGNGVSIY